MTIHQESTTKKLARMNRGRLVTYCPISSEKFIRGQAQILAPEINKIISGYSCRASIHSYTPPYSIADGEMDISDFLIGFVCLEFSRYQHVDRSDEEPFLFLGVEFGHQTKGRRLFRDGVDLKKILEDPLNPQSGNLMAVNFDESWRFICCLLSQIEIQHITVEYGL